MTARAFRQLDVTRAIKAAEAAGPDYAVRVDPRTGIIEICKAALTGATQNAPLADDVPKDDWAIARARRNGGHAA